MLLSMYASYHWAKISKKTYALKMVVFVFLVSYLSARFPASIILAFTFPITFLSFPFYAYIDPIWTEGWYWVDFLGIRFFVTDLAYPLPMGSGQLVVAFPFFLFVNIVGAILGYKISERLTKGSLKEKVFLFSFNSGALSLLGCYIINLSCGVVLGYITGYRLNHSLNNHTLSYAIANTILLFCIYYFWVPAAIATTIYGISKWFRRRRE